MTIASDKKISLGPYTSKIHKEELLVDWELAVKGEEPFRIAPLQ